MTKIERFKALTDIMQETFIRKNTAYGDSFSNSFKEFGIISAVVRMYDKMERIKALTNGAKNEVSDESIKDTLMDLANYCVMTVMELDEPTRIEGGK